MRFINPVTITGDMIFSSSVSEITTWDTSETYSIGDEVELASTHRRYQSLTDVNQGNDPEIENGTHWIDMGATNRWRAFDQALGQYATNDGSIQYQIDPVSRITSVGLIGVAGSSVRIRLHNVTADEVIYDEVLTVSDTSEIVDWWSYYHWDPEYEDEFVFVDLPGFAGNRVIIDIEAGAGQAQIGQICFGKSVTLGTVVEGGGLSYLSYSNVDTDDFGVTSITRRASVRTLTVNVFVTFTQSQRVERWLNRRVREVDAVPTLFFDENLIQAGIFAYGLVEDFSIPFSTAGGVTFSIDIKGLT